MCESVSVCVCVSVCVWSWLENCLKNYSITRGEFERENVNKPRAKTKKKRIKETGQKCVSQSHRQGGYRETHREKERQRRGIERERAKSTVSHWAWVAQRKSTNTERILNTAGKRWRNEQRKRQSGGKPTTATNIERYSSNRGSS